MKNLVLLAFVLGCTNDSARLAELEAQLEECQNRQCPLDHAATPASQLLPAGEIASARPASVQPVAVEQADPATTATVNHSASWSGVESEFNWVSPDITDDQLPAEQGGTAQVVLEPLNLHRDGEDWISTEEAERRLGAQGYRPATGRELRAFAKANPDYQRTHWVVALGSSWVDPDGGRDVPYLNVWCGERGLSLGWIGAGWASGWRVLAVRK